MLKVSAIAKLLLTKMIVFVTNFLPFVEKEFVRQRRASMRDVCSMIASWYSVSLIGFLVYIRKDFLQMSGENALPSIDLNCPEENPDCDNFSELT